MLTMNILKIEYLFAPIFSNSFYCKISRKGFYCNNNSDFARVQLSIRCLELFLALYPLSAQNQCSFRPAAEFEPLPEMGHFFSTFLH